MDRDTALKTLAGLRLAVGVTSWVAPNFGGKLFGLEPDANPQGAYLARLFGVRDAAMAIGPLRTKRKAQRTWIELGILCDAADVAAAALGGGKGYLPPATTAMLGGPPSPRRRSASSRCAASAATCRSTAPTA
jgi:hypothetical protein